MLVIRQEECDWTHTSVNTKDQQKTKEEIKSQKVPSCVQCKVVLLNIGNGVIHHLLHFRSHAGKGREGGRRRKEEEGKDDVIVDMKGHVRGHYDNPSAVTRLSHKH